MKPGWKTSEFWVTIATKCLALLCVAGAITTADEQNLATTATKGITAVFAILAAARVIAEYIKGRSAIKSAAPLLLIGILLFPGDASAQAAPRFALGKGMINMPETADQHPLAYSLETAKLKHADARTRCKGSISMKALSVIQPYATLILSGAKQYETRSWNTSHRGKLAIHASRTVPLEIQFVCLEEPFQTALRAAGYDSAVGLPRGVVLGTVELVEVIATKRLDLNQLSESELAFGDFGPGRYAWKLANPQLLDEPFECIGRPGIFEASP
jgi:uncharacterized membrane protein YgdD (TMEM256/DUF423 family)